MYQKQRIAPISICCICAPSDVPLLVQWEIHLRPLEQAGYLIVWSELHLLAGTNRKQQIDEHMGQANFVLLLLGADFYDSEECLALMQRALQRQQDGEAHVVPLLLRPAAWRESPLAALPCLPSNGSSVAEWGQLDTAFHKCACELLRLLGRPATAPLVFQSMPLSHQQLQNRIRMLRRLHRSYRDLMAQSLQGAIWMELGFTQKPDAVQNAANLLLRTANQAEQQLPPRTSIVQVYEENEHELLILGEPGAGKSTLLLNLAQQLIARAEQEEAFPLPVILPLSSWAVQQPVLEVWLSEQLTQIYDVPRKVSTQWVCGEQILPLLDGLDEMDAASRPACIAAINAYHRDHLIPLVVCSRREEYENAARQQRLFLQNAVLIQPLTSEQVNVTLDQIGKPLEALRRAFKKNVALQDLATTPLMLNVLMLTYWGKSVRGFAHKETLLQKQVWTDYVVRMVERKGRIGRYSLEQTYSWLGWLARQMRSHNQSVFYLEHLQYDWLSKGQYQSYNWLAIRLPSIVIGMLIGIIISLLFDQHHVRIVQDGLLGGIIGAFFSNVLAEKESPLNPSRGSAHKRLVHLISACVVIVVFVGLVFGGFTWLSFGFGGGYSINFTLPLGNAYWLSASYSYGVSIGLSSLLLYLLLPFLPFPLFNKKIKRRWKHIIDPIQTIHGERALLVAVVMGGGLELGDEVSKLSFTPSILPTCTVVLICIMLFLYIFNLKHEQRVRNQRAKRLRWFWCSLVAIGIILDSEAFYFASILHLPASIDFSLDSWLVDGLILLFISIFISLVLEQQMGSIRLVEHVKWSWRSLTKSLLSPKHAKIALLLAGVISLCYEMDSLASDLTSYLDSLQSPIINGPSIDGTYNYLDVVRYVLQNALISGLSIGLAYWLLLGLFQGISSEQIDDQHRYLPNQGIRRSLRNSLLMGIIGGGLIATIIILSREIHGMLRFVELSYMLNPLLNDLGLSVEWIIGGCGGLLICAISGGLAVLRHYELRFLLWRSNTFPRDALQFLDDAIARALLRRVGGGYSFEHRLLLDHFADLDTGTSSSLKAVQINNTRAKA